MVISTASLCTQICCCPGIARAAVCSIRLYLARAVLVAHTNGRRSEAIFVVPQVQSTPSLHAASRPRRDASPYHRTKNNDHELQKNETVKITAHSHCFFFVFASVHLSHLTDRWPRQIVFLERFVYCAVRLIKSRIYMSGRNTSRSPSQNKNK